MDKKTFKIGVLSDRGTVKERNQDSILVLIGENRSGEFGLFAVADGMGGHAAGDAASGIAMSVLKHWWDCIFLAIISNDTDAKLLNHVRDSLYEAVLKANEDIIKYGVSIGQRIGTTLSLLLIYEREYRIIHIGDSRIYRINKILMQLTEDHSWVAGQVLQGILTKEEARKHPRRNVLTKCLGMEEKIDLFEKNGTIESQDIFVLSSDGFYSKLEDHEVLSLLAGCSAGTCDLQHATEALFEIVKDRGEADNISAIFVGTDAMKRANHQAILDTLINIIKYKK